MRDAITSGVWDADDSADELFTRVVVKRTRSSVVLRAYARTDPSPYGTICACVGESILRTVSLRGRLGNRRRPPRAFGRLPAA